MWVEPGRSIVGEAGTTLYRIGTEKRIPGVRHYIAVDGGMTDNPRPALYQAKYEAMLANRALEPNHEVLVTLVPSLARPERSEPARLTVLTEAQEHKVTIYRNAAGEFVASATPPETKVARPSLGDSDQAQSAM